MPDPTLKSDVVAGKSAKGFARRDAAGKKVRPVKRRSLPNNFFLKRLDTLFWKRLLRYFYIRFLRMRGSPRAIARGVAAGVFAGSFPLLGFQSIIGIAIASVVRGNKLMAIACTWVSNPLTYLPIFLFNFHVGRWLLRLPMTTMLTTLPEGTDELMALGMDVVSSLMLGSLVVGVVAGIVSYYLGLAIAQRLRKVKRSQKRP
ncbi:MAG: DUF2062 domain-containing protein [Phormidesmis sp.]